MSKVVHEESEADDVLQESFLQIWREARSYSPEVGQPLGWVITIARRRAIDRVRRRTSYRRAQQRFEDEMKPGTEKDRENVTVSAIASSDLRCFLDRQLQTLPALQRQALELAYFGGLSQREIAKRTRASLGTVKTPDFSWVPEAFTQCIRPLRHKV